MANKSVAGNASNVAEPTNGTAENGGSDLDGIVTPESLAGNANTGSDDGYARDSDGKLILNADGSPRKRRGRKPGGSNGGTSGTGGSKNKAPETNLNGIEAILISVHAMAAAAFQAHELALDKSEAAALASAMASVAEHYPMTLAPKTLAWVNLVMAASAVYGPRIFLIRQRLQKEQEKENNRSNGIIGGGPFGGGIALQ